jgi:tetratricopeptide (TPR) repeat protein
MLPWLLRRVRSWRTWVVLVLVGALAAAGGRLLWAEHQLRLGRAALERRAYAEARAHVDRYLSIWPSNPAAHLLAARCARASGNLDEAERLLITARRLGADHRALALELDLLDAQRGTLPRADVERLWGRVEEGDPETPAILEALAEGCLYTCRLREAMACLERWLAYAPGDSQALYLRGLTWEGLGVLSRAEKDYRQAVRRDPKHIPARKRLAEYLLAAGNLSEAAELFLQLRQEQPEDDSVLLGLARCRRTQARFDEARRLLEELLARDSPPPASLVERARLAQQQGGASAAEKWYRQALARDPSDDEACYGLARCLRELGRVSEAKVYEARAKRIKADVERLHRLHEQMDKGPVGPEVPYEAGMICLRNGQKAEARRWFRNALQRDPGHQGAQRGLEQALEK